MIRANTDSDLELFRRIAEGDEQAFEVLFHAYVPKLHPLINKVTGSESAVKDIIQEVFLYLWTGREQLANVEQPQNWIYKIAYNRSYSWLAKKSMQQKAAAKLVESANQNDLPSLEHDLAFQETARLIREGIHQLPEQAKKVFILSRESGMKAAEIAEHLGISVQTVRNTLSRSAKSVKDHLASHGILLPLVLVCCTVL